MSTDSPSRPPLRLALLGIAALALVGAGAWAIINERADVSPVVSLAGDELTTEQLNGILSSPPGAGEVSAAAVATAADEINNWLIAEAVNDELEARGAGVTDAHESTARTAFVDAPEIDLSSPFGESRLRVQSIVTALTEYADAQALSGDADVDVELPEYLCASHVLVDTEAEALEVIAAIDGGLAFADAAIEFSVGPTGPSGGDLGCADTANYVPEFSDGARANGVGITPPVQSQFGWHVIQVRSIGPLSADVHPEIDPAEAGSFISAAVFDDVVNAARDRVNDGVELDPKYGTWDAELGIIRPPAGVAG